MLTAPDVVLLTWDAVEGATGYILELSIDKGESIPIVALPPERTSYEDLTAPELGNLTYQVQVVTESGPARQKSGQYPDRRASAKSTNGDAGV